MTKTTVKIATDLSFCPRCGCMALVSHYETGIDKCLECSYKGKGQMKTTLKGHTRTKKTDEVWT